MVALICFIAAGIMLIFAGFMIGKLVYGRNGKDGTLFVTQTGNDRWELYLTLEEEVENIASYKNVTLRVKKSKMFKDNASMHPATIISEPIFGPNFGDYRYGK